ncbi:general stress protein [Dictyobacter alpinus]|uniref:General stress protein n=1 Tax=Dictyobacter alpinus TaxID=2014873 RepID=A0A402B9M9_9CHLR|nr:pyridoxamine 5'-phosphate oxidase family protein [Dictyobacter alpinus]GCE28027.1 general stress protein [Dictyobacter alpinus]
MSSQTEHKSDKKLLSEKIKDVRIAMMTTTEPDGTLRSRPMATQDLKAVEFDGDLWFFTYATAPKVGDVEQHQQVNLSYSKPGDNLYISVSGTGQLVQDRQKIKDLWNPIYKAWFPKGQDDPDLALLKVHVESAEYWDAPSGKMGALYSVVKGLTSKGEQPSGSDVKLDMH